MRCSCSSAMPVHAGGSRACRAQPRLTALLLDNTKQVPLQGVDEAGNGGNAVHHPVKRSASMSMGVVEAAPRRECAGAVLVERGGTVQAAVCKIQQQRGQ